MSEPALAEPLSYPTARARVMNLNLAIASLALVTIGVLVGYVILLGPLVGPGVEESFGLAVGLLFLFGALLVHVVDRAYREWPEGRRVLPPAPAPITNRDVARVLGYVVILAAALLIAYLLAGVLS